MAIQNIIICIFLLISSISAQQCSFAGFPCCRSPVSNPAKDKNGYSYGFESGKSCIAADQCKTCLSSPIAINNPPASSSNPISQPAPVIAAPVAPIVCLVGTAVPPVATTTRPASTPRPSAAPTVAPVASTCAFVGFPCCLVSSNNPSYDNNGYAYGFESGRSCIYSAECTACISNSKTPPSGNVAPAPILYGETLNFITRQGYKLMDGNKHYRFISYNTPNLLLVQNRPSSYGMWVPPTPWEQMDACATLAGSYGLVTRTYTFGLGYQQHITGLRTYYEPAFVAFDHALAAARKYGIRLIIPILNDHQGDDSSTNWYYGDYGQFASFRGKKPSQFWTDTQVIDDLKHLLSYVLNRVNTVTGIAYKDDPVILAWQFGNELGSWQKPSAPSSWTTQIARHLKSIAPRTLVMDGTIGGMGRIPQGSWNSPDIDIFTSHYYGGNPSAPGSDAKVAAGYGKAFIAGEYGFGTGDWYDKFMTTTINTPELSGSLIWSLRYHSYEGGFYVHSEGNGYWAYHAPGFAEASGFSKEEATLVPKIRWYALRIQGLDPNTPYPIPDKPVPAFGNVNPKALRWGGSAWAKGYNIERQQSNTGTWTRIASNVPDNVAGPKAIYADNSASAAVDYTYRIQAVGVGGQTSDWLTIGPMRF